MLIVGAHKKQTAPEADTPSAATRSFDSLAAAVDYAGFSLRCSDRLNGGLVTEYAADRTQITVTYGVAGYVRKTLLTQDADEGETVPTAADAADALYDVDGRNVRFVGGGNAVTAAGWTDNGFLYEIILTGQGVTADAMTDYVRATR